MFADRLKELRKHAGINQETLAKIVGVERSSIGKYEGKSGVIPSDDVKAKLAEFFGVSVDYLMCRTDVRLSPSEGMSADEADLIAVFRQLNDEGKKLVKDYAGMIAANETYIKDRYRKSAI